MYNIPANVYELTEAFPADDKMPNGILQGVNDFNKIGYGGPCPPSGMHRYYFKLYALDRFLEMAAGAGKDQVLKALKGHQLGFTQIMGLYGK
jgi:Raf kinase inhibitor-like YbhB/YbcL family protein